MDWFLTVSIMIAAAIAICLVASLIYAIVDGDGTGDRRMHCFVTRSFDCSDLPIGSFASLVTDMMVSPDTKEVVVFADTVRLSDGSGGQERDVICGIALGTSKNPRSTSATEQDSYIAYRFRTDGSEGTEELAFAVTIAIEHCCRIVLSVVRDADHVRDLIMVDGDTAELLRRAPTRQVTMGEAE